MNNNTSKKKGNTAKKLIPAAGMLAVSASMLATSTYAWFTMSREVEVKNIQMTATVPEDIQISLGAIGATNAAAGTQASNGNLAASTGVLVKDAGTTADDATVKAPVNDWDWSNTADISKYYQIGKLIPASSTTGASIYFTPDANGVGKTVRSDAVYTQADGGTPGGAAAAEPAVADGGGGGTYAAKLYAFTDPSNKTWTDYNADSNPTGYRQSTGYNATYSDGYYVDIPVWLRTSSKAGASINVEAYVIPKTTGQLLNSDNEALYRAVRVALLNPTQADGAAAVTPTGLLPVADGMDGITSAAAGNLATNPFSGSSVLNWYNGAATNNVAVKGSGSLTSGAAYATNIYGPATVYAAGTQVVSLTAGQGTEYGTPTKVIIRVWLEGEDPDCWNDTAGQDWSINLKFNNGTATSHDDIAETATAAPVGP